MDPPQSWPAVEITVEAQDRSNTMALHNGDVDRIAGRNLGAVLGDLTGAQYLGFPIGITSSTMPNVTWKAGSMASLR
jgi:hypothetical protein